MTPNEIAARALREAAEEIDWEWETFVADDGVRSIRPHGKSPAELLRERADRVEQAKDRPWSAWGQTTPGRWEARR